MSNTYPLIPGVQLDDVLGIGGNATVYHGIYTLDCSAVAVKVLHPSSDKNSQEIEAEFLMSSVNSLFNHPRIVAVYDYGIIGNTSTIEDHQHWLSMGLSRSHTSRFDWFTKLVPIA